MPLAGPSPDPIATQDSEISLLSIANAIVRERRVVLLTMLVVELILLVVAIRRPVTYTTTVAFMPENQRAAGGVSSLAAQFGVAVPGGDGLSSPQFYPELIKSPPFLGAIVESVFVDSVSGASKSLVDIYGIQGTDPRVRRAMAIQRLGGAVKVSPAPRTGIVTVTVSADRPALARDIAARMLSEITRFNQHTRQSRAAAERRFVERRIAEIRDSLRAAEDRLQAFLIENRDIRTSPAIAFRNARLERQVESQRLLLATLEPSFEQARIEEVRDTPVLTIIRQPEPAVYPDPRGRVRLMILGLFGGFVAGVVIVLGKEAWRRLRGSSEPPAQEFSALTQDIQTNLRQRKFRRALFG